MTKQNSTGQSQIIQAADVINGSALWSVEQGDNLAWLKSLPDQCVDLVLTSSPYEAARTYNVDFNLRGQPFVDWCVERFVECVRVCRGLTAWVIEGQTRQFRWSATPALLMADLHRRGVKLRKPPAFCRVGIPGSGGPDWLRNDFEFVICATHGKLPWSDNTAMGHPPKWAPGGEMSNRLSSGARVNQWGHPIDSGATVTNGDGITRSKGKRPSHRVAEHENFGGGRGEVVKGSHARDIVGKPQPEAFMGYDPPTLANPGNEIKTTFTADEVRGILAACGVTDATASEQVRCIVGGGVMGSDLCHENEAPFPESLAEFFIRSFCPPNGIVCDPHSGSGTTLAVARYLDRRGIACDVRESQVELTKRRMAAEEEKLGLFK